MNHYFSAKTSSDLQGGVDFGELVSRLRKLQCEDESTNGESKMGGLANCTKTGRLLSKYNDDFMFQQTLHSAAVQQVCLRICSAPA